MLGHTMDRCRKCRLLRDLLTFGYLVLGGSLFGGVLGWLTYTEEDEPFEQGHTISAPYRQ